MFFPSKYQHESKFFFSWSISVLQGELLQYSEANQLYEYMYPVPLECPSRPGPHPAPQVIAEYCAEPPVQLPTSSDFPRGGVSVSALLSQSIPSPPALSTSPFSESASLFPAARMVSGKRCGLLKGKKLGGGHTWLGVLAEADSRPSQDRWF